MLVGDSLGMVVLGHEDTTSVTMDQMAHHCAAASRGAKRAMLVGDLPFGSCLTPEDAARNGVRLVKEGRVDAVKIEGGTRSVPHVRRLVDAGVAVVGHIGLTPQSVHALGGFKVQGKTDESAAQLKRDALALQAAGAQLIVMEAVPAAVAGVVTGLLNIPTIGIGAGADCSGQVLVLQDMINVYPGRKAKFVRNFMEGAGSIEAAVRAYVAAVKDGSFPAVEHTFSA